MANIISQSTSDEMRDIISSSPISLDEQLAEIAYNVKSPKYGAKGDGVTDDTTAIQNAINDAMNNGGDVFFPNGYYRVTQPIKVGQSIYTLSDVVNFSGSYSQNTSAITANEGYFPIGLIFASTVGIFADFSPSSLEAVIEYNLLQNTTAEQNSQGRIIGGLAIYGQGFFSNGKPTATSDNPVTNSNLIGLFSCAGAREIANVKCVGLGYGIVNADAYWQRVHDCYGKDNETCFFFRNFNAGKAENLEMWYSTNGIVCDGGAMEIANFHTEEVANDLTINTAEASTFGPAYLEDVSTTDGTGSYFIKMGTSSGASQLNMCTFRNIRIASGRPNKKSYRIWSTKNTTFLNCRSYVSAFDNDSTSGGSFINCDASFIIRSGSWMNMGEGTLNFGLLYSEQPYSISVLEPFHVSIPSTTVGANSYAVVTVPINAISTANAYRFALIGNISGVDGSIVLSASTSGTNLNILLQNISTSSVTTTGNVAGLLVGIN